MRRSVLIISMVFLFSSNAAPSTMAEVIDQTENRPVTVTRLAPAEANIFFEKDGEVILVMGVDYMAFYRPDKEMAGSIYLTEDGVEFDGDVQESAKVFFWFWWESHMKIKAAGDGR